MSAPLLVEAKREYTEQLVLFLRDAMYDDFYVLWKDSVDSPDPMMKFQERLEEVVDWDERTMIQRTDKCISKTGCKFLDDLIVAVFVAHMKILMTIKNTTSKDQYKLQVPTTNKFVYECLLQCSREFWKSPYLFYQNELDNKIKKVQIQKNLRQAEDIISSAIKNTIRGMLPVKEIVGDVLEYDKDGDLVLDIKRSHITSGTKTPKTNVSNDPTPVHTLNTDHTAHTDHTDGSGEGVNELSPIEDLKDTPTPTPDLSGGNEQDTTHVTLSEEVSHVQHEITPDGSGGEGEEDGSTDLLQETIENIRVASGTKGDTEWEYTPPEPKGDREEERGGEGDEGKEEGEDVDWNKGFVLGPIEEDLEIEAVSLEHESKDDVDLGDVVELK